MASGLPTSISMIQTLTFLLWRTAGCVWCRSPYLSAVASWASTHLASEAQMSMLSCVHMVQNHWLRLHNLQSPDSCRPPVALRRRSLPFSTMPSSIRITQATCLFWMMCLEFQRQACRTGAMHWLEHRESLPRFNKPSPHPDPSGTFAQVRGHLYFLWWTFKLVKSYFLQCFILKELEVLQNTYCNL